MKLAPNQFDAASLGHLGEEAFALLLQNDFSTLAERFGYALAYGRIPAQAIEEDFSRCLGEAGTLSIQPPSIEVEFFESNSSSLFAVVKCIAPIGKCVEVLVELVIAGEGQNKYVTLEQISYVN